MQQIGLNGMPYSSYNKHKPFELIRCAFGLQFIEFEDIEYLWFRVQLFFLIRELVHTKICTTPETVSNGLPISITQTEFRFCKTLMKVPGTRN